MESFLASKDYKKMRKMYEKEYFKLHGKYCSFDGNRIEYMTISDMSEHFKNKKVTLEIKETTTSKSGKTVTSTNTISKSFYQIWSEDPDMREYKQIVFQCETDKIQPTQFNTFTGFDHLDDVKPAKDMSVIFEHIKSLVNYNEEHFEFLLDFYAQLVQQPHILPHCIPVIISEEGTGKDLHGDFMSDVIGEKYSGNTEKLELICGKFNSVLGGKLIMFLNETDPVESSKRQENLKQLGTATEVYIESKHKDPIKSKNYCRMIMFSNRLFAFPVESGSRRPKIFQSSNKHLPAVCGVAANETYFTNLCKAYKNRKYQKAFLELLLKRDISKFNPKNVSKSELHKTLEDNSASPMVEFLASTVCVYKKPKFVVSTTMLLKQFNKFLTDRFLKYEVTPKKFTVELKTHFNVTTKKSSITYFHFDVAELKKLLETKYKYNFADEEDSDDEDEDDDASDDGVDKKEKRVVLSKKEQIAHYKKLLAKLEQEDEPKVVAKKAAKKPPTKGFGKIPEYDNHSDSDSDFDDDNFKEDDVDDDEIFGPVKKSKK